MKKKNPWSLPNLRNNSFKESLLLNDETFIDYLERLKKIAISIFEWVNLPKSMDSRYLEKCLFYFGQASFLKDSKYGFINTRCADSGYVNIYGLPTKLNCYSYEYNSMRTLYTGIEGISENRRQYLEDSEAILVMNNWDRIPTLNTIQLFAYRLYECERTCDVNIKAQKTPILLVADEKQRLFLENLYSQYDGNRPAIFGDKNQLDENSIKCINTGSPFVADKILEYKQSIFNEALTFLGINNIMIEKKERLVSDEVNSNNELINLNLQSYLAPRQLACEQFNEKFNITDENKKLKVRVRSDLHNIIKQAQSSIQDFKQLNDIQNLNGEGEDNGNLYN